MSFSRPDEHQACGATNRHGGPCKNWPARRSGGVKRRCRFHGGHSLTGMAHPGYKHGYRSRITRELGEVFHRQARFDLQEAVHLNTLVREKRAELIALVRTIEEIKLEGMTNAEIRAYLRLPLNAFDKGHP